MMSVARVSRSTIDRRWLGWLAILILGMWVGCDRSSNPAPVTPAPPDPLRMMRDAMSVGNWELARQHSQQALVAHPNDPEAITDAAKVAALCDRKREAAHLMVDAAAAADYGPTSRVDFAVQALIDVGELYEAIELLERSLAVHPDNHKHRRTLVGFLGEVQRNELVPPHFEKLIRNRSFDIPFLVAITESSSRRFSPKTPERMLERNPDDHRVRLAEARYLSDSRDAAGAQRVLKEILEHHPQFAPAHALLGQVLVAGQRLDELDPWFDRSPPESDKHADYWLTLGDWAADRDRHAEAARAYWEATRRDPNESTAWTRLALSIRHLRDAGSEAASAVSDEQLDDINRRIAQLLEMRKQFHSFSASNRTSQRYATEVAKGLSDLGRNWEAEAWAAAATTLKEDLADQLPQVRQRIIAKLREDSSWLSKKNNPALTIDLSDLPQPTITSEQPRAARRGSVVPSVLSVDHIQLSEESNHWGLQKIGAKSSPTDASLGPLIRSTGIGGGAIDYDLDGRGDALVMGAGGTMLQSDSFPNELMRNVGDRFVRVTRQAGVGDTGFGQGLGVGDFNEDGFPDLFYGNLGENRLLRNNGDGSFTDCSHLLDDKGAQEWTTCGAFADVNGDRISDLITTNYCETVANLDQPCPNAEGVPGPCHPLKFPAKSDRFFAGSADGRLLDVTSAWTPQVSPGRGLGILAGSLAGDELGVLIVNDMSANEFYTHSDDGSERMTESAAVRGVAVDARTLTQASMGIASGDFDGDGDLEIYVTGFGREYNILYEQVTPGFWKDETGKLGLIEPTLPVVGFGTEAIDLDDDGVDELVVTNGHIGEFDGDSLPYEQPFQVFRRGADGKFVLLEDDAWGAYFSTPHVGRALWTIDANGDGRSDVMITHTHEQLRLLVNRGRDENNRIALKLIGTHNSRDAVGAVVRFDAGGRQRTLWSLSGHGYMCSNEPILRAGLGQASRVENVTVTWQDGSIDRYGTLDANAEYVIVQGESSAFETAKY